MQGCVYFKTWALILRNKLELFYPTGPYTISEPQDWEIGEFYVLVQERRAKNCKAQK